MGHSSRAKTAAAPPTGPMIAPGVAGVSVGVGVNVGVAVISAVGDGLASEDADTGLASSLGVPGSVGARTGLAEGVGVFVIIINCSCGVADTKMGVGGAGLSVSQLTKPMSPHNPAKIMSPLRIDALYAPGGVHNRLCPVAPEYAMPAGQSDRSNRWPLSSKKR